METKNKIKNAIGRENCTFSIDKKTRKKFYHAIVDKFGCTRNHIGEAIDEAIELWIKENKNEEVED